jgi:putative transposase
LLKAAPLSKSAVSRIVGTLKTELESWRTRPLAGLDVFGLYLDALALRVRSAGKVVSVPVLGVVGVLTDGQKQLLALELCPGGETFEAWKGCLDDLVTRELAVPVWCVIDGHPGLRKSVGLVWPQALVQRCCVHKLRNLERKAPKHALAEIPGRLPPDRVRRERSRRARGLHRVRTEVEAPLPRGVRSLQEGGDELLTFFQFHKRQWKTLRTTNVIERLNEEFRRRVKTQGSLPTEDAALVLLFGLVVSGQIRLRRLDGWRQIPAMLRARREAAA